MHKGMGTIFFAANIAEEKFNRIGWKVRVDLAHYTNLIHNGIDSNTVNFGLDGFDTCFGKLELKQFSKPCFPYPSDHL